MVSRISGIGAIITKHEHVAVSNGYGKRAVAWIHAGLKISAFINGFAVDRDGLPGSLAGDGIAGQTDDTACELDVREPLV